MVLRCDQECERHLEGISYLTAVDPKREALVYACHDRQNAKATRCYMHIEVANRLNKTLV